MLADVDVYIDIDKFVKVYVASVRELAQKQAERLFSRALSRRHGLEINLGLLNRAASAGAIDFPAPRFRRRCTVLDDNGKVGVIDHGHSYYHKTLRARFATRALKNNGDRRRNSFKSTYRTPIECRLAPNSFNGVFRVGGLAAILALFGVTFALRTRLARSTFRASPDPRFTSNRPGAAARHAGAAPDRLPRRPSCRLAKARFRRVSDAPRRTGCR